jgi:hypothetical protein
MSMKLQDLNHMPENMMRIEILTLHWVIGFTLSLCPSSRLAESAAIGQNWALTAGSALARVVASLSLNPLYPSEWAGTAA